MGEGPIDNGGFKRIHNGRREEADGPPGEKGRVEFNLGLARRSAYVEKLDGVGVFESLGTLRGYIPYSVRPAIARFVITTFVEFLRDVILKNYPLSPFSFYDGVMV